MNPTLILSVCGAIAGLLAALTGCGLRLRRQQRHIARLEAEAGDALRIRWANGWLDELRYIGPGYQVRSWRPATVFDAAGNPAEPPTNTGGARRAE